MSIASVSDIKTPTRPRPTLLRSLMVNARVIGALIMRDGTMRFGHENLGFFWVIGEPMVLTCGVMLMWTISGQTHGHGVGVVPFALSGYTMITLWRHLSSRQMHVIRSNVGLLFHRNISVIDVLLARCLLESTAILAAFFVAWTPLYLLGFVDPMADPLLFAAGYGLQCWYSAAFGLILSALSEMYEVSEQLVPPIMYITIPFTGVFSLCAWLPEQWRNAILWSPLVSNIEMLRAGLFPGDTVFYYYPTYVVLSALTLTAIALPLVQHARKHVTFS